MSLSNTPPKGTTDWLPDEYKIRKYIFDTWRSCCTSFGYEEYLTPLVEYADVYKAKSGEDIANTELTTFTDRGGRELAIRPEMTPSVTRMVTKIYNSAPKPLRLFSIANFYRNENPQRGRNREFWQLNFDIFGSSSLQADIEILQLSLEIMLAFHPPVGSFTLKLNSRLLLDSILHGLDMQTQTSTLRILDKYHKLPIEEIINRLAHIGLSPETRQVLLDLMQTTSLEQLVDQYPSLKESAGFVELNTIINALSERGYADWVSFSPTVLRGFDYYNGMVFEVFDNHPENSRAMFGGGRYNDLASIFDTQSFPSVGCAPGDETTRLFLQTWNLLPNSNKHSLYIPLLNEHLSKQIQSLANNLRKTHTINMGLEIQSLPKALEYANKHHHSHILIFGSQEATDKVYIIKDLNSGLQQKHPLPHV